MKGKNTLRDKPFRYGGLFKDYSKEIHEITGCEQKCWCCGRDMKSHVPEIKIMPYTATFRISKGKNKGLQSITDALCLDAIIQNTPR